MKSFVIILLFALLFISQINTILDVDLWWNLKAGEYIVKNREIPRFDIFSYTLTQKTWIDHEWLSQALLYLVFFRFSWLGLNILKAFLICLSFFILLFLVSYKNKEIITGVFFILLSVLALGYRSFLRPELFSYLLLCLYFYILETEKRIFLLPILQIVWVNLHGYFILGPILVFLYYAGDALSCRRHNAKELGLIFILVTLSCLMNPYFYEGALYPLKILMSIFTDQRLFMRNVHELMMPIKPGFARYLFFWIFAILTSVTFLINIKQAKIKHILTFAFSFFASYMAVRNMPVFIFLAMPLAAINLNEARLTVRIPEKKYYAVSILAICALGYFFLSNKYYMFTNQYGLRKTESRFSKLFMPAGACDFLQKNKIEGRLFNTLDFGPYIGYRFYPEKRIFIDTRTDLYKDDFYKLYRDAQNYPEKWQRLHEDYGFQIVLLRHLFGGTERLLGYLYRDGDWSMVYYDENSVVFLYDSPENAETIDKFRVVFSEKEPKASDFNINTARFFAKIGEVGLAEKVYDRLLMRDPDFLEAANNLAAIYVDTQRCDEALKLIQSFLQRYPKSAELYANMGTAYLRLGDREQGLFMLEKSARLDPYLRKASYMLGLVYLERGEQNKAERQFIKYLRLDPYDAEVHRILGGIYTQKGLLKEAQSEYNEADALEGL